MAGTGILRRVRIGAAVLASFITDPLKRFWCAVVGHGPQKVEVTALIDDTGRHSISRDGVVVICLRCSEGLKDVVWVDPVAGQVVMRRRA